MAVSYRDRGQAGRYAVGATSSRRVSVGDASAVERIGAGAASQLVRVVAADPKGRVYARGSEWGAHPAPALSRQGVEEGV
jgi:hypothetical protein